ncbi:MAG TPA: hypothetical protein VFE62_26550 [Gemmataceae bacterium]|nr:hypothetical protein [Gemmataceae bacterium]
MRNPLAWAALLILAIASPVPAQAVRIGESFAPDARYYVSCQVDIVGNLTIPATKDGAAKQIKIEGKSTIKYDERILAKSNGKERTIRNYHELEFERKVGTESQRSKLRPAAQQLVILRHNQYEVPFSPKVALTWGEIELVRTDVFAPALAGLFPAQPVAVGASWSATNMAIQELTDLDKIDKADFKCTFEKITTLLGRRNAHVRFEGNVTGLGEDGNALHEINGSYYVDLDAGFLTYLYVKGTHHLLDRNGKKTGKIEGTFVMTRDRLPHSKLVDDEALRGLTLEPNADNTLLLFEHPNANFLYPRNWRIAGVNDKQVGVDEARGSGILLTFSPANATPTGAQFRQDIQQWLGKQQAKVYREEKLQTVSSGLEMFAFEADVAKHRVLLQYYTIRQGNQGATITARMLPGDTNALRDLDRIARSVHLRGN